MKLNAVEKVLLHNQYEILRRVDPAQAEEYDLILKCLYAGYDDDLDDLMPDFDQALDMSIRQEVRDILQMFRALSGSYDQKPAAVFIGFDGNEESRHYAYARFLLEDRGLWQESKGNSYNTHWPVLPDYREMLRVWHELPDQWDLNPEQIAAIVQHAPEKSKVRER